MTQEQAACSPLFLFSLFHMDSPIEDSLQTNIICLQIRTLNYVSIVGLFLFCYLVL
jgi:hypothetical protein